MSAIGSAPVLAPGACGPYEPHGLSLGDVRRVIKASDIYYVDIDQFYACGAAVGFGQVPMRLYDGGEYSSPS